MSLTHRQRHRLRAALGGRLMAVCYGAGVDSTAMLVALKQAGLRPDIITFADLSAEKPPTLEHLDRMDRVLAEWSWPAIVRCRKETLPGTGYSDLYGNCIANETLPSLAFGLKSCSIKWKQKPQDHAIKGARSGPNAAPPHPVWTEAQRRGVRIVKLIGYDCGPRGSAPFYEPAESRCGFRLRLSAPDSRLEPHRLRARHHRCARCRHGSDKIGLLFLPGIKGLGAELAGRTSSRSPRARLDS